MSVNILIDANGNEVAFLSKNSKNKIKEKVRNLLQDKDRNEYEQLVKDNIAKFSENFLFKDKVTSYEFDVVVNNSDKANGDDPTAPKSNRAAKREKSKNVESGEQVADSTTESVTESTTESVTESTTDPKEDKVYVHLKLKRVDNEAYLRKLKLRQSLRQCREKRCANQDLVEKMKFKKDTRITEAMTEAYLKAKKTVPAQLYVPDPKEVLESPSESKFAFQMFSYHCKKYLKEKLNVPDDKIEERLLEFPFSKYMYLMTGLNPITNDLFDPDAVPSDMDAGALQLPEGLDEAMGVVPQNAEFGVNQEEEDEDMEVDSDDEPVSSTEQVKETVVEQQAVAPA